MATEMMQQPLQQAMKVPGTKPYEALFGGAASQVTATLGEFQAPTTKHKLATYRWAPQTESSRGVIILVHGYAEHMARSNHVASYFAKQGFEVVGIDHYLHGLSEGFKGMGGRLDSYEGWISDWSEFVRAEVISKPGPHICYSHSTGAMITLLGLAGGLEAEWPNLKAVVYSSPLCQLGGDSEEKLYNCPGCTSCCLSCLAGCCPCCTMPEGPHDVLSTYKDFVKAAEADPMYFGWTVNLTVLKGLFQGTVAMKQHYDKIKYPFVVVATEEDKVINPKAARRMYEASPSTTKDFLTQPFVGFHHELHNHEDWQKPLSTALSWLEEKGLVQKV